MNVYLPVPRVPSVDLTLPSEGDLRALGVPAKALAPIKAIREAHEAAAAAAAAVEAGRPGGADWTAALAADAAVYMDGKEPTALADLMRGEPSRYGLAHAAARAVALVRAKVDVAALKAATLKAADALTERAEPEFLEAARAAWEARAVRSTCWAHHEGASAALLDIRRAACARAWANGWESRVKSAHHVGNLSESAEANGFYLATGRVLEPQAKWLTLPQGVTWPTGFDVNSQEAYGPGVADLYDRGHRELPESDAGRGLSRLRS